MRAHVFACGLLAVFLCGPRWLPAAETLDLRVRIAWGGGEARSWQGTIRLSEGSFEEVTPLGLEPDEPGSMQLADDATLTIDARSPRTYDGCDLRIQAPANAKLLVQLTAPPFLPTAPLELPLARVLRDFTQFSLDDRNNRLLAQRAPGDGLRVSIARSSLVFSPGEKLELEVQPQHLDLAAGSSYQLSATLTHARLEDSLWNADSEFRTEAAGDVKPIKLSVPLPEFEGAFDVRLAVYPKRLITSNLVRGKPIASRSVQAVTVAAVRTNNSPIAPWQSVLAFDPASPKWWEAMTRLPSWTRLPAIPRPVSSGATTTASHLGRGWVELGPRGWQAYPLSITTPGTPHLLEVEFPSDLPQTLAISLVEPNAAGIVGPIGLDSGIEVLPPEAGHKPGVRKHRLPCWPQTRTPYLLLVNRSTEHRAVFGKIEVQAGPDRLPPLIPSQATNPGRVLAAYYDKPFFVENFSAPEAVDSVSRRALRDWATFLIGGQRLIETLQYSGHNAVVLTAACEGSAIYPSRLLEPTPKYDLGVFFESGQDVQRKDVLELLFRLCDRSGIVLIPALQFNGPLPKLEQLRLRGGDDAIGLEPTGPDGRNWRDRNASQAAGAYYNLLDPRVQQAMLEVVEELAERYGQHASFGGVAVQLTAESHALLPDETCSLDEKTFRRFLDDSGSEAPANANDSPMTRWSYLRNTAYAAWLRWRCEQTAAFYDRVQTKIESHRAGARLVLTTADLLAGRQLQAAMRPELPARSSAVEIMPLLGLDPSRLGPGIILPRPQRLVVGPSAALDAQTHWNQHAGLDAFFLRTQPASGLHFLPPAPFRLPDFDAASPFGADKTKTLFVSQLIPADAAARERFATSIARLDPLSLFDGGWLLPLGQEAAVAPLVKVFRRLPAEPFEAVENTSGSQEVVVRSLARSDRTIFYAVNPTPWPLTVNIDLRGSQPLKMLPYLEERAGRAEPNADGLAWTVEMQPFDLVGGEVTGTAKVVLASVKPPADAGDALREQIGDILKRAHFLAERPRHITLPNAGFEEAAEGNGLLHWLYARETGIVVERELASGVNSGSALHLVSRGTAPLWVRSSPLPVPSTGRLKVTAKVRIADAARQPQLRMAVEGRLDGQVYYQRVNYGAPERPQDEAPAALSTEWTECAIACLKLPVQGLSDLRVGFDLMGPGEVWIDEVEVTDLWLQEGEYKELLKSVPTAKRKLEEGRLNECRLLTGGYWPSFLRRHVNLSGGPGTAPLAPPEGTAAAPRAPRGKVNLLPPSIPMPQLPARTTRSADRNRTWWPSWMKWK